MLSVVVVVVAYGVLPTSMPGSHTRWTINHTNTDEGIDAVDAVDALKTMRDGMLVVGSSSSMVTSNNASSNAVKSILFALRRREL